MSAIVVSTDVDRPAAEVYAYATDPEHFGEWQKGVVAGHLDSDGPPAVGDLCRTSRRIGGAVRESTSRITRLDPPHAWGVQGIDGPIRATVDLTVEPVTPSSSRLTIAVDFTGHGIGKVLVPLVVRREARAEMPENVTALKNRVESR
jgi:uncharacterized protein YndB with AHSA1/START domain